MELSFEQVAVDLGGKRVLATIDARFQPGRITVVLGPNGAGKTTLLRAAAGLQKLASGTIRLGDTAVSALTTGDRARAIGYLPQSATVHWDVTARDLVAIGRAPHRSPFAALAPADHAAIAGALAATGTTDFADRPVQSLSGGERARVLLARVLAGEPRWILADEPLASLDPAHQLDVLDRLRAVAAGGTGVVLVLHDLFHAARIADDVLLLQSGRTVAFGPAAEVLRPDTLGTVYGIDLHTGHDPAGRPLLVPLGRRAGA